MDLLLNSATLHNMQCSFTSSSLGCYPEAKTQIWDSAFERTSTWWLMTLCPAFTMPWAFPCSNPLPSTCTQLSPGCFTWARGVKLLATALHFRLPGFLRLKVKPLQLVSVSGLTAGCKYCWSCRPTILRILFWVKLFSKPMWRIIREGVEEEGYYRQ